MPFFITSYDLIVSEAEQMMEGSCQTRKLKKKSRVELLCVRKFAS